MLKLFYMKQLHFWRITHLTLYKLVQRQYFTGNHCLLGWSGHLIKVILSYILVLIGFG